MDMNKLIAHIFDLADTYYLYGSINEDSLVRHNELGKGAEYVAECFCDQDGGEAPDVFYDCLVELFEEY